MRKIKLKKGFTLIELLLVVSIIALLSAIVLSNLQESREKAETVRFRQEVNEFIKAVELYKANNNGSLPINAEVCGENSSYFNVANNNGFDVEDPCGLLVNLSQFINDYPKPPKQYMQFSYFDKLYADAEEVSCGSNQYEYMILVSDGIQGFESWSNPSGGGYGGNKCIVF